MRPVLTTHIFLHKRIPAHTPNHNERISADAIPRPPLDRPFATWHSSCYSPVRLRSHALHKNN